MVWAECLANSVDELYIYSSDEKIQLPLFWACAKECLNAFLGLCRRSQQTSNVLSKQFNFLTFSRTKDFHMQRKYIGGMSQGGIKSPAPLCQSKCSKLSQLRR